MIVVITTQEEDKSTKMMTTVVSHGYDTISGNNVILPNFSPGSIGAVYNSVIGEYVIRDGE